LSLGKKDIVNNISSEAFLLKSTAKDLLDTFINIIKSNSSKNIKISNFGTFSMKTTPERVGRNPKTKKEYTISKRKKLVFKASTFVKNNLN
tara:strand:- start:254 stop:526 length:273 start_codon:yes stop_codon:yes gene_type:complete